MQVDRKKISKDLAELRPINPMRPADWRWNRAVILVDLEELTGERPNVQEPTVDLVIKYVRGKHKCDKDGEGYEALAKRYPLLYEADMIYGQALQARWMLEGALLSGEKPARIAEAFGIPETVIGTYESVFFDVQARLKHNLFIEGVVLDSTIRNGLTAANTDKYCKLLGWISYGVGLGIGPLLSNWSVLTTTPAVEKFYNDLIMGKSSRNMAAAVVTQRIDARNTEFISKLFIDARKMVREEKEAKQLELANSSKPMDRENLGGLKLHMSQVNRKVAIKREVRAEDQVSDELARIVAASDKPVLALPAPAEEKEV